MAELKTWATPLSISRFRQHTLNKFSTVGNTINSHRKELIYHFKLNENYRRIIDTSSGSLSYDGVIQRFAISSSDQNISIVDSAPKTTLTTNYSITKTGGFFTGSFVYELLIFLKKCSTIFFPLLPPTSC